MLNAKENLLEVIKGGHPDRFVNQYEAIQLLFHPHMFHNPRPTPGAGEVKNAWGVTLSWPEGHPGSFPVHTGEAIVVRDIESWREYVKAPPLRFPAEEWAQCRAMYDAVDGEKAFKAAFVAPGLFEQTHFLCSVPEALMNYMIYPDEMHDLIKYLTDWELELAEGICTNLHPDAIFHHDDWGSEDSTFLSPQMFADFFTEPYRQIYDYYRRHGVRLIVHHSDSYAATLVPSMIDMGIDIWQGVMASNDIPSLVRQYGGKISFMGGIDNKLVDHEGWTAEECRAAVHAVCDGMDPRFFIPCITQGGPGSCCPGAYQALWEEIDRYNSERFGVQNAQDSRLPLSVMF